MLEYFPRVEGGESQESAAWLRCMLVHTSTTSGRLWMFWNAIGQPKAASLMIVIYFLDIHANKRDLYY